MLHCTNIVASNHSICCNNINKINKICCCCCCGCSSSIHQVRIQVLSRSSHGERERSWIRHPKIPTRYCCILVGVVAFLERERERGSSGQTVCLCLHPCCCCNLGCMLVRELEKAMYVCRLLFLLRQRFDQVECCGFGERERERERECVCVLYEIV